MQRISNVLLSGAAFAAFLAACGGGGGSTTSSGTTSTSSGSNGGGGMGGATTSGTTTSTGTTGSSPFTTVFIILMENHDYAEIVGSANAPYVNSLIAQGGLATNYFDSGTHPSLPNYLYLISGDTQYPGGLDVGPHASPWFPSMGDNLGNQMEKAGINWRSYQESMGTACNLTDASPYATKHDPFLYFDDIQNAANGLCAKRNVDYTQFAADLATGAYQFMWITPNLKSDGHDPGSDPVAALKFSDTWLSNEVPKILASDAYKNGGALFLTWDEAEGRNGNDGDQIPMIVLSPKLKMPGMQVTTKLTHASWLATMEGIYGLPKLGAAANAGDLMEFFNP